MTAMEVTDIGNLRMELRRSAEDIRQLKARKELARIKVRDLESKILGLKKSGAVPKQIWRFENELAKLTRERNALANELERARIREQTRMQSLKRIEEKNRKTLEMKRPRKIRR